MSRSALESYRKMAAQYREKAFACSCSWSRELYVQIAVLHDRRVRCLEAGTRFSAYTEMPGPWVMQSLRQFSGVR